MLVLTRKKNEMIQVGSDIVIKVIATGRGKVKIGIDAPANVRVLRGELSEKTDCEARDGDSDGEPQPAGQRIIHPVA